MLYGVPWWQFLIQLGVVLLFIYGVCHMVSYDVRRLSKKFHGRSGQDIDSILDRDSRYREDDGMAPYIIEGQVRKHRKGK